MPNPWAPDGLALARRPRWPAIARLALYALVVVGPVLVMLAVARPGPNALIAAGRAVALAGAALILVQPVLAARLRWVSWPFGLPRVLGWHRVAPRLALALLLMHPILIAWGYGTARVVLEPAGWALPLGWAALLLLGVQWFASEFRREVGLGFQTWRWGHNVLGVGLLVAALGHSYVLGPDMSRAAFRVGWPAAFAAAAAVYLYHKLIRPLRLRRRQWMVTAVTAENEQVTTLTLTPPEGRRRFDYLPGQFHFITLHRPGRSLPTEEHHFTISSSPTGSDAVTSTIKSVGDFTRTIPQTRPGDTAEVLGPFGRFSYLLEPEPAALVFIAGGIGITPLMSMIRHLRDTEADRDVLLIYGNRREDDIVFRDELDAVAAGGRPRLRIVHVLSDPDESWTGPTGYVTRSLLAEHVGDEPASRAYYLCGPPPMMERVRAGLRRIGVPKRRIHWERFAL